MYRTVCVFCLAALLGPTLANSQVEDTMPPRLEQLIINTPVIDTTVGAATFTATVRVRDDLAGIRDVTLVIRASTGRGFDTRCVRVGIVNALEEIFECSITFSTFSALGTYVLERFILRDNVVNTREIFSSDLAELGFPSTFQNANLSGQPDTDNDGVPDANDNCPDDANADQSDQDLDGIGDVCDPNPDEPPQALPDADGDSVADIFDNCPEDPNPDQADADGDRIGDTCDNCLPLANRSQTDGDGNGFGDVCDALADFVGPGEVSGEEFEALTAEVAGLEARIAELEAAGLGEEIQTLKDQLAELQRRLAAIEDLPGIRNRLGR